MTPYFIPSFMLDLLIIHKGSPLILNSFFIDFHWFSLPQPRHPAGRRPRTPYAHTIITQLMPSFILHLLIIYKGGPLLLNSFYSFMRGIYLAPGGYILPLFHFLLYINQFLDFQSILYRGRIYPPGAGSIPFFSLVFIGFSYIYIFSCLLLKKGLIL